MRHTALALIAASFLIGSAQAADAEKPKSSTQQQRMKDCNAAAKEKTLKGEPRKQFMSQCLKGKPAS